MRTFLVILCMLLAASLAQTWSALHEHIKNPPAANLQAPPPVERCSMEKLEGSWFEGGISVDL